MRMGDPVAEAVLRSHGVEGEKAELKKGPRDPKKIDAIVRDIQSANKPQ